MPELPHWLWSIGSSSVFLKHELRNWKHSECISFWFVPRFLYLHFLAKRRLVARDCQVLGCCEKGKVILGWAAMNPIPSAHPSMPLLKLQTKLAIRGGRGREGDDDNLWDKSEPPSARSNIPNFPFTSRNRSFPYLVNTSTCLLYAKLLIELWLEHFP